MASDSESECDLGDEPSNFLDLIFGLPPSRDEFYDVAPSWCGEAQLCDCLVRNSGMEAPHAAALAQTARTYKNMLRRRHKGGFHTFELLTTGSDLAEQLKQAHPVCLREYGI